VSLRARVPDRITDEELVAAVRKEMAYYREHAHEGRDPESLDDLRRRCAELISSELGVPISADELVASVRFDPYPDAEPALAELRERGVRLVVVSNWDISLATVLEHCGLLSKLDAAISSAEADSRKPDPGIFTLALRTAECSPDEALHVGDTPEEDCDGARAAGIRPLLIDRDEGRGDIASLAEIVDHL
jgi:putative hydrolase of the HAD superfamily